MTFPVTVNDRKGRAKAVIYGKTAAYPFYRVAYWAAGKRMVVSCRTYSEAHRKAKAAVKALAKGSQSVALTAKEAADALAIRDMLAGFYRDTGRTTTALQAVTGFVDAMKLVPAGHNLVDAVRGYMQSPFIAWARALSTRA